MSIGGFPALSAWAQGGFAVSSDTAAQSGGEDAGAGPAGPAAVAAVAVPVIEAGPAVVAAQDGDGANKPLASYRESREITQPFDTREGKAYFWAQMELAAARMNQCLENPEFLRGLFQGMVLINREGVVANMSEAQRAELRKVSARMFMIAKVAWVDSSRYQGSCWGDSITDLFVMLMRNFADPLSSNERKLFMIKPSNFTDLHPVYGCGEGTPLGKLIRELPRIIEEVTAMTVPPEWFTRDGNPAVTEARVRNMIVVNGCPQGKVCQLALKTHTYGTPSLFLMIAPTGQVSVKFVEIGSEYLFLRDKDGQARLVRINPDENSKTYAAGAHAAKAKAHEGAGPFPAPRTDHTLMVLEIPLKEVRSRYYRDEDRGGADLVAAGGRDWAVEGRVEMGTAGGPFKSGVPEDIFTKYQLKEGAACLTLLHNVVIDDSRQIDQEVLFDLLLKVLSSYSSEALSEVVASPIGALMRRSDAGGGAGGGAEETVEDGDGDWTIIEEEGNPAEDVWASDISSDEEEDSDDY